MGIHTCTKNLLSILPMVSDFCWRCAMSHSASQYATCTTRSIKNPHLHLKTSRKTRLINTVLPKIAPLISGTCLAGSWCSQHHTLAFILNPKTSEVSITAPDCFLFILPLHQSLVASEDMQHTGLLSTATAYDPKHHKNGSRFKRVYWDIKRGSGKAGPKLCSSRLLQSSK